MEKVSHTSSPHIICVGVDPTFVAYILTKTKTLNPYLDICGNLQAAREKISSNAYDVYIIDLGLSAPLVLDLIHEIRQKETKRSIIVVIVDKAKEESYLKDFKENKEVDYLIEKPMIENQMDNLLKEIFQGEPQGNTLNKKLVELKLKYDSTINDKIELISRLARAAKENPEKIYELKSEVHKISGTAGSFGYAPVSKCCKEMEIEINSKIQDGTYKDIQWLSSLDAFIQKVKQGFQTSANEETITTTKKVLAPTKPFLFVIDDDVNFLDLLERIKEDFPFDLEVEFDPQRALDRLKSPDFNPNGIIVSQTFQISTLTGLEIIKQIQSMKSGSGNLCFGLLLEVDNIDLRIEATQNGINYIFRKPVSANVMLDAMAVALEKKSLSSIRVLILDDDAEFCDFVTIVLSEIGISTFAVNESANLFKALEEYRPNILLLDLVLPKYDGMNLLKTLRQDISYKNLIIVIVTSSERLDISTKAYAANVDDILFKPIDKTILQNRILNIAERRISLNVSPDNYTGLLNARDLMENLGDLLKKSGQQESSLVLFEIHDLKKWIQKNGHNSLNDLMIFISNQLQWEADYTMKSYLYQTSTFAIVFNGVEPNAVEKKMYNFLSKLVQKETRWHLSFNCSIVPISKNYMSASKVLKVAEQGLVEAANKEPAAVKVVLRLPKGETISKKEIVIIDSDSNLLKILKQAFESYGIIVNTYNEGGEALKDLFTYSENRLPSLMILERKLADMDGMELYVKLKSRFRTTIPLFVLTVFSSDKDVADGIKQGVLEYIIKPFNISILVQKALQVIFKDGNPS